MGRYLQPQATLKAQHVVLQHSYINVKLIYLPVTPHISRACCVLEVVASLKMMTI